MHERLLPCERETDYTGHHRIPPNINGSLTSHHRLSTVIAGCHVVAAWPRANHQGELGLPATRTRGRRGSSHLSELVQIAVSAQVRWGVRAFAGFLRWPVLEDRAWPGCFYRIRLRCECWWPL